MSIIHIEANIYPIVRVIGIEPTTSPTPRERSTDDLHPDAVVFYHHILKRPNQNDIKEYMAGAEGELRPNDQLPSLPNGQEVPSVKISLEWSPTTLKAMGELAEITGASSIEQLIDDRLRTIEWVVRQQSLGRTIVALEEPELKLLETSPDVSGERPSLVSYIVPNKIDQAKNYFKTPSPA